MNLREARCEATRLLARLIQYMVDQGYKPALGKDGLKHMANSLHYEGLAWDIDLYNDEGEYLSDTVDHYGMGQFWKSLDKNCRWGGDFHDEYGKPRPDGNHYSYAPPEVVGNRA